MRTYLDIHSNGHVHFSDKFIVMSGIEDNVKSSFFLYVSAGDTSILPHTIYIFRKT